MESKKIIIDKIEDGIVNFEVLNNFEFNIREENVVDIEELFNRIFNYITEEKEYLSFSLSEDVVGEEIDLEILRTLFDSLNAEIISSNENFVQIIKDFETIDTFTTTYC